MKRNYCKTTMLPIWMAILLSLFMVQSGFAQERSITVTGNITSADDGLSVPGTNIIIQGTNLSTEADFDGNFKINVKSDDVLVISYVGYKTQKVVIKNQSTILSLIHI